MQWMQFYQRNRLIATSKHTKCFVHGRRSTVYRNLMKRQYKPSTVWSMYSMLKKTLICKQNVDMKQYCRLRAFLKTNSDGYKPKQTLVFSSEEIRKFIVDAPDVSYLAMKVTTKKFTIFIYF